MTLTDYMNPEKFPTTSQQGCSPHEQLRLDAFNHDQLEEAIAGGHQMDEEQIQIRKELAAKRPWMAELTRQIAAAINLDKMPEMAPPMINNDMDEEPLSKADEEGEDLDFATHLGIAIMSIIKDASLTAADKHKKILGALKLMAEDYENEDEDEDDDEDDDEDEDEDEDFEKQLGNAIIAIINDDALSTTDKRIKVLGALNLLDDDEIPGMAPPHTICTDMDAATPTEAFDQAFLDRLPPSDRPFMKLSPEQLKTMCEQVVKILKVTREQEERDRKTYREMYGEEMPEM